MPLEQLDTILIMKYFFLSSIWLVSLSSCGGNPPVEQKSDAPSKPGQQPSQGTVQASPTISTQNGLKRHLTPKEKNEVVDKILQVRAREQAAGLGKGSVTVNRAWNYTGYSYLSVNPDLNIEARLVAVDLTASGHTPNFDFDDIEIVDGDTMISYGSDPHAVPLNLSDGQIMPIDQAPAAAPRASRWLMIYAFPKNTKTLNLFYWGQKLTLQPMDIAPKGWELPYPEQ